MLHTIYVLSENVKYLEIQPVQADDSVWITIQLQAGFLALTRSVFRPGRTLAAWRPGPTGSHGWPTGNAEAQGSEVDRRSPQALTLCVGLRETRGPRRPLIICNRKRRELYGTPTEDDCPGKSFPDHSEGVLQSSSMTRRDRDRPTSQGCGPSDPPGSPVHGILPARILQWAAVPFSRGPSRPGIELSSLASPASAGGFFLASASWEALYPFKFSKNRPAHTPQRVSLSLAPERESYC